MAPSVSLNIPYGDGIPSKRVNLQDEVQQFVRQKGPFRHISETQLLKDLELQGPEIGDDVDEKATNDGDAPVESRQATRDRLVQMQFDCVQTLRAIFDNLGIAIDGLSSSLAATSRAAENAISPTVKQSIPVGSIEARRVEPKASKKLAIRQAKDISFTARAEAFTNASERMRAAADRLSREADRQTKYWQQLARLHTAGWPISRIPQNNRAIVVHVGSAESNPEYRNQGIVALQQDETGDLSFRGAVAIHKRKTLCVRILRNSKVTGEFVCRKDFDRSTKVEADLLHLRESLFQEELFSEAVKEARAMTNMGVRTRANTIDVDLSEDILVNISYLALQNETLKQLGPDHELAVFVGEALRLMLVAEHQQRYVQRSEQRPPPLSQNARPSIEYALLRPVTAQLRHHNFLMPVLEIMRSYQKSLRRAGLELTVNHDANGEAKSQRTRLSDLRRMVVSKLQLKLPSGALLTLTAETHLAAPRFGTQFCSTEFSSGECGTTVVPQTSSADDVVQCIEDAMARDISSMLLRETLNGPRWEVNSLYPIELLARDQHETESTRVTISCRKGKLGILCRQAGEKQSERIIWDQQTAQVQREDGSKQHITDTLVERLETYIS